MEVPPPALTPPTPFTEDLSSSRASSRRRRAETDDSEKAGRVWAREVEDAWWPCILCLDGGGIRGYSSLLILKALMHEVWLWEERLEKEEMDEEMDESREESYPRKSQDSAVAGAADNTASVGNTAPGTLAQDRLTSGYTKARASREEELLPCHYFDFMYGTSTGGLIATMLGRLRMTVDECLELYRKVGDDLFGRRRSSIPLTTKYYHEPLERAVRDIVARRCHEHENCTGEELHPLGPNVDPVMGLHAFDVDRPRVCQSCCLTATHDENISEAYLLRTYPHYYSESAPNWITRYNEGADDLKIWQVTRATTAAPFYFKLLEVEVEGQYKRSFKDGGIRENNPSGAALSEFHSLYEGRADNPALLLSVGTGRPDQKQDGFASAWPGPWGHIPWVRQALEKRAVLQNLLIKYTEGERQHAQMREHARGEHTWYKRLNVSYGLQTMPLDDWRKGEWHGKDVPGGASLSHMERVTETYLARDFDEKIDSYAPPDTMLKQSAEKLARQRRAREAEGGLRWETFVGRHLHRPAVASDESVAQPG